MAQITFLIQPELGHILPTLRVALTLRSRGHCVRYLSLPKFASFFAGLGIDWSPISLGIENAFEQPSTAPGHGEQPYQRIYARLSEAGLSLPALLINALAGVTSDLILIDSCLMTPKVAKALMPFQHLCVRLGVTLPDDRQTAAMPDVPELILCPRDLELPELKPASHQRYFVEPSIFLARAHGTFPVVDCYKPLIYCSLGTQSLSYEHRTRTLDKIFECFALRDDLQLLVSVAATESRDDFPHPPPNVELCAGVGQLKALQHAALFITHGGLGSVKEAIFARVPMILIPFGHDQPLNAARVCYHRLGRSVTGHDWSAADLNALLSTVMHDTEIQAQLDHFYSIFTRAEEASASIQHIEYFLEKLHTT